MTDLRYDYMAAYDLGIDSHAQVQMGALGITYGKAVPQTMGDQWWFFNCSPIPDPLPAYLSVLDLGPTMLARIVDNNTPTHVHDWYEVAFPFAMCDHRATDEEVRQFQDGDGDMTGWVKYEVPAWRCRDCYAMEWHDPREAQ